MQLAQLETCLTIFQFVLDQSFVFVLKLSTLRRFWSHNVFIHAVKTGLILTSAEFCSHSTFKSLEFTYLGSIALLSHNTFNVKCKIYNKRIQTQ